MRVAIIGTGYVGLVAGAGFADFGNDIICADVDKAKIDLLEKGGIPIYEPGLDDLIARNVKTGRIKFTTDVLDAMKKSDVVFVAVGTPPAADGSADLSAVYKVAETFGKSLDGTFKLIVDKSTVPVGTADRVREIATQHANGHPFAVASNPEFLKEGAAITDFMKPDRVVIGVDDDRARDLLRQLYSPFVRTSDRIHVMDPRSAELTKYAANAMLAVRISFMNDLALLAEKIGADIEAVRRGVGSDARIGPKFLYPGPGYGGSCFPKDLSALVFLADKMGHQLEVVRAAENVNVRQKKVLADKIQRHFSGDLKGKIVGVWGLAFKPETDDIRESPALVLVSELLERGATVRAHDPEAMENVRAIFGEKVKLTNDMYEVAEGADALALVTEWHTFRSPDFQRLKSIMRTPALFDGRNIWPNTELVKLGFSYEGIGRRRV